MPISQLAISELKINPIGHNRLLVRSEWNSSCVVLQEHEVSILPHLMSFKSETQHEETLAALIKSKNLPLNAKYFMKKLHEHRLFIRTSSLCKNLNSTISGDSVKIENIVMPTANNPKLCFDTLRGNLSTLDNPANLWIIDSSLDPMVGKQYVDQIKLLGQTKNVKCTYIGQSEIESMISFLSRKGFDTEILEFGLRPRAGVLNTGQGRNIGHLLNINRPYLSSDDDVEWLFTKSNSNVGLSFSTIPQSIDIRFLSKKTYEEQIASAKQMDPRKILSSFLTKDSHQLCQEFDPDLQFLPLKDRSLESFFLRHEKIGCVLPGLFGESGTSSSIDLFNLSPSGDRSLWETSTDEKLKSRLLLRFSQSNSIYDGNWFMAPCFALDGSLLVPPFPPEVRNQDGLWASIWHNSTLDRPFAFLHQAIHHKPTRPRLGIFEDLQLDALRVRFDQILLSFLQSLSNRISSKIGYKTLASILEDISNLPENSFLEWLRDIELEILTKRKMRFHKLQAQTSFKGKLTMLATGIQTIEKHLLSYNLKSSPDNHQQFMKWQTYIKRFAQLLMVWEDLGKAMQGYPES